MNDKNDAKTNDLYELYQKWDENGLKDGWAILYMDGFWFQPSIWLKKNSIHICRGYTLRLPIWEWVYKNLFYINVCLFFFSLPQPKYVSFMIVSFHFRFQDLFLYLPYSQTMLMNILFSGIECRFFFYSSLFIRSISRFNCENYVSDAKTE